MTLFDADDVVYLTPDSPNGKNEKLSFSQFQGHHTRIMVISEELGQNVSSAIIFSISKLSYRTKYLSIA